MTVALLLLLLSRLSRVRLCVDGHEYGFQTHQKRLTWKCGQCRFPQFKELSTDHSWDADSRCLNGKSDFCLCLSFYGGRRWTTQSVDNPISGQPNLEGTPSQIQVLETFLNLCPQTQEFEAIDTDTIVDEKTQSTDKYYFFFIVILFFCFLFF